MIAGGLLALSGPAVVQRGVRQVGFWLVWRWESEPRASALPGERFVSAMRVGLQHVWQSPHMRAVMFRVFLFFLQSSALLALRPQLARQSGCGAAMMLKGLKAQYLLKRVRPTEGLEPGDFVLFHAAAGGLGLIACQWA